MVSAIIVAAGSSRRMGFDKLFASLAGKPVVMHSICAFEKCDVVSDIVVVTKNERIAEFEKFVADEELRKVRKIIAGGDERHLSVWEGLRAVNAKAEFIAIHDGARPLTTPEMIRDCFALARETGAACCASLIPDTLKRADESRIVSESVERSGLWAMQTPQIFSSALILQAYAGVIATHELVTDEVSAVQRLGKKIALLRNDEWNFKITLPRDLELAEHVLSTRTRARRKKQPKEQTKRNARKSEQKENKAKASGQ